MDPLNDYPDLIDARTGKPPRPLPKRKSSTCDLDWDLTREQRRKHAGFVVQAEDDGKARGGRPGIRLNA